MALEKDDRSFGKLEPMDPAELILDEAVYGESPVVPPNDLALDVSIRGVLEPIIVHQDGKAKKVIAGAKRLESLKMSGRADAIPARLLAFVTPGEAVVIHKITNLYTQEKLPSERRAEMVRLRNEIKSIHKEHSEWPKGSVLDNTAIVALLAGRSRAYIFFELDIEKKLPSALKKYMDLGWLPFKEASRIAGWDKETIEDLEDSVESSNPESREDLAEAIEKISESLKGSLSLQRALYFLERAEKSYNENTLEKPDAKLLKRISNALSAIKSINS